MSTFTRVLSTTCVAVWAAGCSEAPTARADAAKARIAALAAEADTYAPAAHAEARQAVERLDAELAEQAGGFGPFRSYGTTNELIAAVEAAAENVTAAIEAGKARLAGETDQLADQTQRALAEVRGSLDDMASGRRPAESTAAWQTDLAAAEASLEQAERLRASGQHAEAQQAFRSASEAVTRVRTSIAAHNAEVMEARDAAAARMARGDVTLPRGLLADGKPLRPGTYRLELREEAPANEGIRAARWVEFVSGGKASGRALSVVVPDSEIGEIAATPGPRNGTRIATLKGGEYVRVWMNRQGVNYLIHLPTS